MQRFLFPAVGGLWDLGQSAGFRLRNIYLSGLIECGSVVSPTIGPTAAQQHTLPNVTSDTIALLGAAQGYFGGLKQFGCSVTFVGATVTFSSSINIADAIGPTSSRQHTLQNVASGVLALTKDLTDRGIGSVAAETIADLDDATVPSGIYYSDTGTLGTNPVSAGTLGVVIHRVVGTRGLQIFSATATDNLFWRRRTGSAWQAWQAVGSSSGSYQPLDADLTTLAGFTWSANNVLIGNSGPALMAIGTNQTLGRDSTSALVQKTVSDTAWTLLANGTAAAMRTTLGLDALGIGITSNTAAVIADLDDATVLSGLYTSGSTTIGTNPISAGSQGVVLHRISGNAGSQLWIGLTRAFWRTRAASVWGAWQEVPALGAANTWTGINTFNAAVVAAAIGPTSARQHNLPNVASDTIVLLGIAQTFAGEIKFSNAHRPIVSNGAPAGKAAGSTLTAAEVATGWCNYTGAAGTLTLPTGTLLDAAFTAPALAVGDRFDFDVINTGTGAATLTAAAGFTIAANTSVAAGRTARLLVRKTAANTFILCGP